MFPAARKGDPVTHDMQVPSGVIGPPISGPCPQGLIMIEGLPGAHVGCTVVCSGATSTGPAHPPPPGPSPPIVKGSVTVLIHGQPAARWLVSGDIGACGVFLGDAKLLASRTVLIGDIAYSGLGLTMSTDETCADLWKQVDSDTKAIAEVKDPVERNRKISATYSKLYQQNNRLAWVGLAAIVSRQAGCSMKIAHEASKSWIPMKSQPAAAAFDALGKTNQAIFDDIYPVSRFYQRSGLQKLEECAVDENGIRHASPKLVDAMKDIDKGTDETIRSGSDKIANYEQRDIIQDQIYSQQAFKEAFEKNEWWTKRRLGRWMGARRTELPLSSECTDHDPVRLEGSITDPDARVAYYNQLMDRFQGQRPGWRQQTMKRIEQLGQ